MVHIVTNDFKGLNKGIGTVYTAYLWLYYEQCETKSWKMGDGYELFLIAILHHCNIPKGVFLASIVM